MTFRSTELVGVFGITLLLLANACTYPISKQLRNEARKAPITPATVLENPAACKGKIVVWGGKVIETRNITGGTEIIMLDTPLDFLGVPGEAQSSRGRFIARSPAFLDPAIYAADRSITLAGEVIGAEEKALGETTYTYPVISIKELYLWEKDYPGSSNYWYGPFWGPSYYKPGPGYYRH